MHSAKGILSGSIEHYRGSWVRWMKTGCTKDPLEAGRDDGRLQQTVVKVKRVSRAQSIAVCTKSWWRDISIDLVKGTFQEYFRTRTKKSNTNFYRIGLYCVESLETFNLHEKHRRGTSSVETGARRPFVSVLGSVNHWQQETNLLWFPSLKHSTWVYGRSGIDASQVGEVTCCCHVKAHSIPIREILDERFVEICLEINDTLCRHAGMRAFWWCNVVMTKHIGLIFFCYSSACKSKSKEYLFRIWFPTCCA